MIVKRGITSFFNWDERDTIPEFTFAEFKRVVFGVADPLRLAVTQLTERGVTPNFHSAHLDGGETSVAMLGHSTYPIIAFSEHWKHNDGQLRLVDCIRIATELKRMFPHVTVAESGELTRKLTESDLALLDEGELDQIKYWKPQTVGEIAFNWWD